METCSPKGREKSTGRFQQCSANHRHLLWWNSCWQMQEWTLQLLVSSSHSSSIQAGYLDCWESFFAAHRRSAQERSSSAFLWVSSHPKQPDLEHHPRSTFWKRRNQISQVYKNITLVVKIWRGFVQEVRRDKSMTETWYSIYSWAGEFPLVAGSPKVRFSHSANSMTTRSAILNRDEKTVLGIKRYLSCLISAVFSLWLGHVELFLGVSKLLFETLEFENISQFVLGYDRAAIGEYFVRSISDFSLQKIL